MQLFQITLAEDLTSTGWILWAVDRDRRHGERRRSGRGTPDRRARHETTTEGQPMQL
jgi:hypothetical protein